MGAFAVWLVGKVLLLPLTAPQRNKVLIHILDSLKVTPLSAIIGVNGNGELTISGRTLDIEKGRQLQSHANAALDNKALNLIRQQVMYEALIHGGLKTETVEGLTFSRAAVWWGQQEEKHLMLLAQRQQQQPEL